MFFKKKRSNKLLPGNGIRGRLLLSSLQTACAIALLWTFVLALVFPAYRHVCIIVQLFALYVLIMDGISKS